MTDGDKPLKPGREAVNPERDPVNLQEIDEVLARVDRESAYRRLRGPWAWVVAFMGIGLALFHLYTSVFGLLPPQLQRAPHVAVALGMIFLLFPARPRWYRRQSTPWYDVILALLALSAGFYLVFFYEDLIRRAGAYILPDLIVAALGVVLVLEATRRVAGWPMVLVAAAFLSYAFLGPYLPGLFGHRGYSLERVLAHTYLGLEGIFGTPVGVSATVIFVYLIFAAFLAQTGIRNFFIDVAQALTGRSPGGPAKAAVVSSAFEGTISGSSIANTAGSGSFTIPMMKGLGYRPPFAAAVEASASTGGQIMPPIMGAAAFVMVEFLNVPYLEIVKAAAIPALLYFTGVFVSVHLEARRTGMVGLPPDQVPRLGEVLLRRGYLIIPLVAILYLMDHGASPAKAAVWGIALSWLFGLARPETRMGLRSIIATLEEAARTALGVIAACATAGIIVGIVTLTGLGLKISNNLVDLAGGNLWPALVLTMLASLVLGMGIPTTATYIVLATMAGPALVQLGVDPLAAHLFVFYFGVVADITPPVALAVYAGSAIAGSNPWQTGVEAVKLAAGAFLVPFIFAVNPALLLIDVSLGGFIPLLITSLLGMYAVGAAAIGYFFRPSTPWVRIICLAAGLFLVNPGAATDLAGLGLLVVARFLPGAVHPPTKNYLSSP